MLSIKKTLMSSVMKKVVMAVTGCVLAAFLAMHMLGNLQNLEGGPHAINAYANFLQTLPWEFLWGFRIVIALCFVVHFSMATLLVIENTKARPQKYAIKNTIVKSPAAYTMIYTGVLILAFAVLHIMHYTILNLDPSFKILDWRCTEGIYEGKIIHDVYAMMIIGFSNNWVSIGYILAMAFIGFHITHGVSSMFQSVGLRNEVIRYKLNLIAAVYAVVIFGGFCLNPLAVLAGKYMPDCAVKTFNSISPLKIPPVNQVLMQYEQLKSQGKDPIFIDYAAIVAACDANKGTAASKK